MLQKALVCSHTVVRVYGLSVVELWTAGIKNNFAANSNLEAMKNIFT